MRNKILYVEKVAQLFADSLAIPHDHTTRLVEVEAEDPSACFPTKLNVYQLQPQLCEERNGDQLNPLYDLPSHITAPLIKQRAGSDGPLLTS